MFSIPYLIARLYPEKTIDEQQQLVNFCDTNGTEYYGRTWQVARNDLRSQVVQANLVKTLFHTQFRPWDSVQSIMQSLEMWSEGSLLFPDFSNEENVFYQRYYMFTGFISFDQLSVDQQIFLLSSEFLLSACVLGMPVYVNVQHYFATVTSISVLKFNADLFSTAMEANSTLFGSPGKISKPIKEWLQAFAATVPTNVSEKINEFMSNSMEVRRLDEAEKKILEKIVTLYWGLKGGFIYREIKAEDVIVSGTGQRVPTDPGKTFTDYFFETVGDLSEKQMEEWLADWPHIGLWIVETGQDQTFMTRLLYTLTQKVNLENDKQTSSLLEFLTSLSQEAGWELSGDLLYFEEKDGTFHWNDEIVEGLKAGVEEIERKKETNTSPASDIRPPEDLAAGIKDLTS